MYPEFAISDEEWKAFVADREGAIAGEGTAKKFGWKVGDRIPIKGTIFPGQWEFNLRGIYHGTRQADDVTQFWFQWKLLDEHKQFTKGLVGWYVLRIDNPDNAVRISRQIDEMFSNSPYETKTDTEKSFAAGWVKQMGNIEFLILSIGAVVFFTLLLVTGNTMAVAVRERVRELAVLKAVGFSNRFVLVLVLCESFVIAGIGGALGILLAKLFSLRGDPTVGMLPYFHLDTLAMGLGGVLALAVGLVSGILPAVSASRLRVVDALRRV